MAQETGIQQTGFESGAHAAGTNIGSVNVDAGNHNDLQVGHRFYFAQQATIWNWLPSHNFGEAHEDIRRAAKIQEQTNHLSGDSHAGKWLLESGEFDAWRSGALRKLWYIGMPGAGKSVLASIIISHMKETLASFVRERKKGRIAYLYLDPRHRQTNERSGSGEDGKTLLLKFLGSIIKQITEGDAPHESLKGIWNQSRQGQNQPSIEDLAKVIRDLAGDGSTFIIIDALDECPPEIRERLIKSLQTPDDRISLLVTSRYLQEFDDISRDFVRSQVRARSTDLELFIDYTVKHNKRLRKNFERDPNIREEVNHVVRDSCDGMFLLASLQMESLKSALSNDDLRIQLRELPTGITPMYDMILSRIRNQPQPHARFAIEILCWATFARGPLAIEEIQHALSIDPVSCKFSAGRLCSTEDIRDLCLGLVTVGANAMTLVHATARNFLVDYLHDQIQDSFPDVHAVIAKTCIHYLASIKSPGSRDALYKQYPLAQYAARNLGFHLGHIKEGSDRNVLPLLKCLLVEPSTRHTFLLLLDNLQAVASTNLALSFAQQIPQDSDETGDRDNEVRLSPRSRAADVQSGYMEHTSECDYTALHIAAYLGWPPIVSFFANDSTDLDRKAFCGSTPLMVAIHAGSWASIPVLLKHGSSVDLATEEGHAVILLCAQQDQRDIVKSLIAESASSASCSIPPSSADNPTVPNSKQFVLENLRTATNVVLTALSNIWSILNCISICTHAQAESYFEISGDDRHYTTQPQDFSPKWYLDILLAAEAGDHASIKQLMACTETLTWSRKLFMTLYTALFLAAEFGHISVVKWIIMNGAGKLDLDARSLRMNTLLHRATKHNNVALVEFLLQKGAKVDAKNDRDESPLHVDFDLEHLPVLQALIRGGADINAGGHEGSSRLYVAAADGLLEQVRFCLEIGMYPSIQTVYLWAPLHWAAHNGRTECVRELLEAGADPSPVSDQSKTPLDLVCNMPDREQIIAMLLNAGAQTAQQILDLRMQEWATEFDRLVSASLPADNEDHRAARTPVSNEHDRKDETNGDLPASDTVASDPPPSSLDLSSRIQDFLRYLQATLQKLDSREDIDPTDLFQLIDSAEDYLLEAVQIYISQTPDMKKNTEIESLINETGRRISGMMYRCVESMADEQSNT